MGLRALQRHRHLPAAAALISVLLYTALVTSHIVSLATSLACPAHLALWLNPSPQAILVAMRRSLRWPNQTIPTKTFLLPLPRNAPFVQDMRLCTLVSLAALLSSYWARLPPRTPALLATAN